MELLYSMPRGICRSIKKQWKNLTLCAIINKILVGTKRVKVMKKILLIDDAALMRNILKRMFESNGYEICGQAASGEQGIQLYEKCRPDVVICDLKMKEMDGITCMQKLLAFDPKARVIICSAQGRETFADICKNAGAKDYIVKPFQVNEVLKIVERVLDDADYKQLMMERAEQAGYSQKDVLDFFAAFRSVTGVDMGDESVKKAYLRDVKASVGIGAVAFLSAKMSLDKINGLVDILGGLCE